MRSVDLSRLLKDIFSDYPNGLLKMASSKAAGSEEPEAYESVR